MKPWAAHWILFNCDFVTERGFHICIITLKEPENLTVISLREETAKRRRHDAMRSSVHSRAGVIVLTGGKLTMGFFDFLKGPDINQGIAEYRGTQGAVLLDVRTAQEYRGGHIPGSKNIPLQSLGRDHSRFLFQKRSSSQFMRFLFNLVFYHSFRPIASGDSPEASHFRFYLAPFGKV